MRPISDFIGLEYAFHGRSFDGVDCYGLVLLWHKNQGVTLPDWDYSSSPSQRDVAQVFDRGRQEALWQVIGMPMEGDIILLRVDGLPSHCGVVVGPNRFLHVTEQHNSCVEHWTNPFWRDRVVGFYRFTGRAA